MDERQTKLRAWLQQTLGADFSMEALQNDASFRRYFRITLAGGSLVAVDVPPSKEGLGDFLEVGRRLRRAGVRAPRVHAHDDANGWMLLDDLGRHTLAQVLTPDNADALYRLALDELTRIQRADKHGLPNYGRALLVQEMCLFTDWYCDAHLRCGMTESRHGIFAHAFELLADSAAAQPRVFVHRDYHSRNLTAPDAGGGAVGVLDYQDAVAGPVTYDLVALLKDCYVAWPEERRRRWLRYYLQHNPLDAAPDVIERWFDWMGIQRHLKAIGIFARLHHRDGKSGYLKDIPRILGYVAECIGRYPELDGLRRAIAELPRPR